jgi:hypothetical protein
VHGIGTVSLAQRTWTVGSSAMDDNLPVAFPGWVRAVVTLISDTEQIGTH